MAVRVEVCSALTIDVEVGNKRNIGLEFVPSGKCFHMGNVVVTCSYLLEEIRHDRLPVKFLFVNAICSGDKVEPSCRISARRSHRCRCTHTGIQKMAPWSEERI